MAGGASALTEGVTRKLVGILEGNPTPQKLNDALRLLAKWRVALITNTLANRSGMTIAAGPFAGMEFSVPSSEGARVARLLGAYEASLAPVIEAIVLRDYRLVIDVGSAEGYYAVGLARRMPLARVLARDADPWAQTLCRRLADANSVGGQVEVGGRMEHSDFDLCNSVRSVVICDIEGAEEELMDPERAPGLRNADILVEVHDCFKPGLSAVIAGRFAQSHTVTRIDRRLAPEHLPDWTEEWSDMDRLLALWEWRIGPTPWLWMEKH